MINEPRQVFAEKKGLEISGLCETAGFSCVYSGPFFDDEDEEEDEWKEIRPNLGGFSPHVRDFLGRITVLQSAPDIGKSPEQHYLYAKSIENVDGHDYDGVEMFHFWNDRVWETGNDGEQTVYNGLTYFCFADHRAVNLELERVRGTGRDKIPLNFKHIYPDKWSAQALKRLMWYAGALEVSGSDD